eukprot:5258513-Prymnesium_polylepis.1
MHRAPYTSRVHVGIIGTFKIHRHRRALQPECGDESEYDGCNSVTLCTMSILLAWEDKSEFRACNDLIMLVDTGVYTTRAIGLSR